MGNIDQVSVLFLLILVGFIVRKTNLISKTFQKEVSSYVVNVALPAFIMTSVSVSISDEMLRNTGILLIVGVAFFTLSILLSYIIARVFNIKGKAKDIYQFVLTFPNVAYMGYPVVASVYGQRGVFYAAVLNMIFNILIWSLGVFFMKRNSDDHQIRESRMSMGSRIKSIFNPALYAVIIGFALALLKIRIPETLMSVFKMVGNTTSPLSMMFIGFTLTEIHLKELIGDYRLYLVSGIRLIGLPVLYFLLLSPFISGEILGVTILLIGMPAAVNTAILAASYGNDYRLAGKVVFVSTLASLVTIPLMVNFFVA